ncbi:PREDICTED: ubiquinol-cytochrome-c reductase complex assembly factor 1 [Ceratosolen solmsi marchali]|uniref:Ubiquinol-cytochrome-c reductase complex assembly factor 1 n=1 Tax=Ceratosolen solmsi marchali TaxID=326594 RepID=A0AAJ6YEF2_9HYME|nr:PREDICTED: ubiquinol-cytochrome-c reductase complex assembly factor 1 [Ceratosolen solmsi marchali]
MSLNIYSFISIKNLTLRGAILYENIVDKLDYNYFYKEFTMEDTFFSWFLITELHVWMLMLRVMQEGENGLNLRNYIVEAMWNDVNIRAKKLGATNSTLIKSNIKLLYEQFNASIIGYDETVGSNDKFLASHIWRRFFKCNMDNPEKLEKLVYYIRKQVDTLSHTTITEILSPPSNINWIYK